MNTIQPTHSLWQTRWAHRLAAACACAMFPLIWVGGLVTTYDAGMAVPDWPSTYGDHLWFYSWGEWLSGPWDLFIEHGHRLLGSLVGLLAIALLMIVWWPRSTSLADVQAPRFCRLISLRTLSVGLFLAVLSQGILGGLRVVLVERDLARLHGCCGPLVFAFSCLVWATTSPAWNQMPLVASPLPAQRMWVRQAWLTFVLVFCQIALGSCLRHLPASLTPGSFQVLVVAHIAVAVLTTLTIVGLAWRGRTLFGGPTAPRQDQTTCRENRQGLGAMQRAAYLVLLQLGLGTATWIAKYSWPAWLGWVPGSAGYVVQADGTIPSVIITAHVAVGALILANTAVSAWWSSRALRSGCMADRGHQAPDYLSIGGSHSLCEVRA